MEELSPSSKVESVEHLTTLDAVRKELSSLDFLSESEIALMASIKDHDPATYDHSVNTFVLARDKLAAVPLLQTLITKENVPVEDFYKACLLHDVGKTAIPSFILNNTRSNQELLHQFAEMLIAEPDEALSLTTEINNQAVQAMIDQGASAPVVEKYLITKENIRPFKFLPAKYILNNEETQQLQDSGFNPEVPLGKIIAQHEEKSSEILEQAGLPLVAVLAGHHHRGLRFNSDEQPQLVSSISSLHIDKILADLVHIADIQQALQGRRSYQREGGNALLEAVYSIVTDAKKGIVSPQIARIWIEDEVAAISLPETDFSHEAEKSQRQKREIDEFMAAYAPELWGGGGFVDSKGGQLPPSGGSEQAA